MEAKAQQQEQQRVVREQRDPMREVMDPLQFHQDGADLGAMVPVGNRGGAAYSDVITAQRVGVPRNMTRILTNLKALARAAGKEYVYGWEVNDRKKGRKVWIEGPTIGLANDLAREYGNNQIDCRVLDEGKHWIFYARFVDLETGASMVRAYQQRKGQDTGMEDNQRALDMIFQIGQSKAIRNVVVNALRSLANFCVEEAKSSLLDKVAGNPDGARNWIRTQLERLGVSIKRVEAIYGRTAEHWTVPDMARIYTELQSVIDGMVNVDDVYPKAEDVAKKREVESPLAPAEKESKEPAAQEQTLSDAAPAVVSAPVAAARVVGKAPEDVADAAEKTIAAPKGKKKGASLFGNE